MEYLIGAFPCSPGLCAEFRNKDGLDCERRQVVLWGLFEERHIPELVTGTEIVGLVYAPGHAKLRRVDDPDIIDGKNFYRYIQRPAPVSANINVSEKTYTGG